MNDLSIRPPAYFLIVILVFWGQALIAQEIEEYRPVKFSLKEAQEYAVKHSMQTKNARLDVKIAKKKIWETAADGMPQIDGKLSYQNFLKLPTTLVPAQIFDPNAPPGSFIELKFGTQHTATIDLTASQLIFRGSYIVGLQASRVYRRFTEENLEKSAILVKELVSQTYYLILLTERTREILSTSLENLKRTLYETGELYKAGFAEETDVQQLQLSVNDLEIQVKTLATQIRITYKLLRYQMGMENDELIELTDSLDDILGRIDIPEMATRQLQLDLHIDFRMAKTQEQAARLTWKNEIAAYLPSISMFFTHSISAQREEFDFFKKSAGSWFKSTVLGLNLNLPIWSSGMRKAKVAQAKLELEKARNSRAYVAEGLELAMMQARSDFLDAMDKKDNNEGNVDLAKTIYDKTLTKFKEGTATSLELTQTYNQYLAAESNYTASVVELLNAKIQLDKALNLL
jgi:outer membrane protein TolC